MKKKITKISDCLPSKSVSLTSALREVYLGIKNFPSHRVYGWHAVSGEVYILTLLQYMRQEILENERQDPAGMQEKQNKPEINTDRRHV